MLGSEAGPFSASDFCITFFVASPGGFHDRRTSSTTVRVLRVRPWRDSVSFVCTTRPFFLLFGLLFFDEVLSLWTFIGLC
jgi:hypothetical protein